MQAHLEFERIEAYLEGQMDPAARQAFEAELAERPPLARAVSQHLEAHQHLEHALALRWKNQMQSWANPEPRSSRRLLKYGVFSLLVALLAGIVLINLWPASPSALFREYYETPILSGKRAQASPAWQEIALAYHKGNYARAGTLLEDFLAAAAPEGIPQATYYLGVCYLETGQLELAIRQFQAVSPLSSYQQDAQWALALSYLAREDTQAAGEVLREITEAPRHFRKKQAKEILNRLEAGH